MIHFSDRKSICLNSNLSLVDTVLPVLLAFSPIQYLCLQCDRLTKLPASRATHPKTLKVWRAGARSIIGRSKDGGREKPCASYPHLRHVLETLQALQKEEACLHSRARITICSWSYDKQRWRKHFKVLQLNISFSFKITKVKSSIINPRFTLTQCSNYAWDLPAVWTLMDGARMLAHAEKCCVMEACTNWLKSGQKTHTCKLLLIWAGPGVVIVTNCQNSHQTTRKKGVADSYDKTS